MRVIEIAQFGGPEGLRQAERPDVAAGPGEVLVRVAAAGVNRPDIFQRLGRYPPPPGASDIPGLELAGTIEALGEGVTGWRVGDQVCALVAGGGYASLAAVPHQQVLRVPTGLSLIEAAALPETYFTVWTNVFDRGRLKAGESILIHGGTSGIGTTAIQLAREHGAWIFTTAGSDEKCEAARELGADLAFNYRTTDWAAAAKEATGGKGVDVILDIVGGDYIPRNLDLLAIEGRLVQIAFLRTAKVELDLNILMRKRAWITGSTLRPRSPEQKGEIRDALLARVWPLLDAGTVRPIVHAVVPFAQAAEAHRLMESSAHIGKIVLDLGA